MPSITECYIQISPDEIFEDVSKNTYTNKNPSSIKAIFNWRSNALIDFIWRELKKHDIKSESYKTISLHLCSKPRDGYRIFDKIIKYDVLFDEKKYRSFDQNQEKEIQDFIIDNMMHGIDELNKLRNDIPKDILFNIIEDFRSNNYQLNWIHKTKKITINKKKFICNLKCTENMNHFILEYIVYDENSEEVYKNKILQTIPSSTFYISELRKIKFISDRINYKDVKIAEIDFGSFILK